MFVKHLVAALVALSVLAAPAAFATSTPIKGLKSTKTHHTAVVKTTKSAHPKTATKAKTPAKTVSKKVTKTTTKAKTPVKATKTTKTAKAAKSTKN